MPIYDFVCEKCGAEQNDVLMRVSEDAPSCPECGETMSRKVSKGTGFVLKGSGWASDGYKGYGCRK